MGLFIGLILLLLAVFWLLQIVNLMGRPDSDFPGRNDKVLWMIILVVLPVLGAVAYWMWKPLNVESPDSLKRELQEMRAKRAKG